MEDTVESTTKSFTEHVFQFDDGTKCELINIGQYVTLALVPVLLLNKLIHVYSPEPDESKHSAEIGLEIISQTIVLFLGMFFIHRLITFVPTYSGEAYKETNVLTPALGFLVIVLSIQSRLGEKMNILYERVMEVLGYSDPPPTKASHVKTSQPIHGHPMNHPQGPIQQPAQQIQPSHDIRGDYMRQEPMSNQGGAPPIQQPQFQQSPPPAQSQDYQYPQPGQDMMFQEPMAANEAFGGQGVAF